MVTVRNLVESYSPHLDEVAENAVQAAFENIAYTVEHEGGLKEQFLQYVLKKNMQWIIYDLLDEMDLYREYRYVAGVAKAVVDLASKSGADLKMPKQSWLKSESSDSKIGKPYSMRTLKSKGYSDALAQSVMDRYVRSEMRRGGADDFASTMVDVEDVLMVASGEYDQSDERALVKYINKHLAPHREHANKMEKDFYPS